MRRPFGILRYLFGALVALFLASTAEAQTSYRISPGDVLQVEVLEDPSLNRSTLVLPDGRVAFPLAGSVLAAGRSVDQFREALTQALSPSFAAEPTVFVSVQRLASQTDLPMAAEDLISVYAIGEFANPGRFEVEPGTTLLQFLATSGGLTRFAADKRIQLRRRDPSGRELVYSFNYNAVERGGRIQGELTLRPGDVVVAPERRLFE